MVERGEGDDEHAAKQQIKDYWYRRTYKSTTNIPGKRGRSMLYYLLTKWGAESVEGVMKERTVKQKMETNGTELVRSPRTP